MTDEPTRGLDEGALRALVPRVLANLVRRGEDFDAAEDALQEAQVEALRVWPEHPPRDPRAWLTTVATRRLVDARRSESARRHREDATFAEPRPAATEEGDDTLFLLFCCCHPELPPASQVALTLRAVGGLTTREIADAFYVPEATMAQRISRAKRALQGRHLDRPGDLAVVLRVLYLVYTAGHAGRVHGVDTAGEAIRLARQLTLATDEPEARGLLALMLLNHARLPARLDSAGRIVTLDRQDRRRWDTREIAEGVRVLQSALAVQGPGRYQIEAAIAALHDDAARADETDWPQILAWYDDLVALTDDPVHQDPAAVLGRAVAVGHVLGAAAGLRETDRLRDVIGERQRWHAVRGYLHELDGDLPAAASAYAAAAGRATDVAERDHLIRQAARARASEPQPSIGTRTSTVGRVDWRELSDGVLVRRHRSFDVNVGLVVGDGHCLVIDTREHLGAGRELAAAVRRVTAAPWTVVNTHAHFDHFMGNGAFLPGEIWSLDRTRDIIERYGEVQRRVMVSLALRGEPAELAAELTAELEATPVTPPSRIFPPPATVLDIGGREVTLRHLGRGHTDNDIVISVAGSDVVFAGDLVEEGAPPAFEDAYPIAWGPSLDGLFELLSGPVVPGHGDVVDAAFVREQRALHARVADVARGAGTTVRGLPDDVATIALTRARAELAGTLTLPTPQEVLARFGLPSDS